MGAGRGNDIIDLRWLKRLLNCSRLIRSAREPVTRESLFVQELGDRGALFDLPLASFYCRQIFDATKIKMKPLRLFVEEGLCSGEVLTKHLGDCRS